MLTNGFINCAPLIRTHRKVFRLTLCAPEKTIANKHERWILRAIEGVGISDNLDVRSALPQRKPQNASKSLPPRQARNGDICLAYQGLLRATLA